MSRLLFFSPFSVLICLISIPYSVSAQKNKITIGLRLPIQLDLQKTDMPSFANGYNPNGPSISKASVVNWGVDVLLDKTFGKNIGVYIGFGYFNNRFGLSRFYDHQLLNIGIDSLPISTTVKSYTYHLLRVPLGLTYEILKSGKIKTTLAIEDISSFSFERDYDGGKPFPDANTKLSGFRYFGNSFLVYLNFIKPLSKTSSIKLSPYIRILNTFKKDPILFETKATSRVFDSFGISATYLLTSN